MQRLVQQIRHLVTGQDTTVPDMPLNRIAHAKAMTARSPPSRPSSWPRPAARAARRTCSDRIGVR
jgi:hypothetical protein